MTIMQSRKSRRITVLLVVFFILVTSVSVVYVRTLNYSNEAGEVLTGNEIQDSIQEYEYAWSNSEEDTLLKKLVETAKERTREDVTYDASYVTIDYPGGDVPADQGVCTDLVIRAYRGIGIDLQKDIHEDMSAHFSDYPDLWNLTHPDSNIDHRRVQNLEVLFAKYGEVLPITENPDDFMPGDLVVWRFSSSMIHIGIVVDEKSTDGERFLIVHNAGGGTNMQDVLFVWPIIGHYRYFGMRGS